MEECKDEQGSTAEKGIAAKEEVENEEEMDVPDNFFDEFEDNEFVDHLIDSVLPEKEDEKGDAKASKSNSREKRSSSPMVERCLQEIDKLTKDIQRRKRKLEREMTNKELPSSSTDIRRRRSRSRSGGRTRSPGRRVRSKSPIQAPRKYIHFDSIVTRPLEYRSARPVSHRNRSPIRRSRSRERRRIPYARSRSPYRKRTRADSPASGSSYTTKKSMTFMEELEKKFAEQGKEFPEKYMLMNARKTATISASGPRPPLLKLPVPVGIESMPPLPPAAPMPPNNMYQQAPYPSHSYYGSVEPTPMYMYPTYSGNPVAPMIVPRPPAPLPVDPPAKLKKPPPPPPRQLKSVQKEERAVSPPPVDEFATEQFTDRVLNRCITAIHLLRADENKVPKKKFLFTPPLSAYVTSAANTAVPDKRKNVEFRLTAKCGIAVKPPHVQLTGLPREIARILGFDGTQILSEMRVKHLADQVINDFEESLNKENVTFADTGCQTLDYKCNVCAERESRKRTVHSTQTEEEPKKATRSIRSQTNEQNYRDPLFRKLSAMSSAQLVAVADYVRILNAPAPANAAEIVKLREELMDVYNLASRDDDQVRVAERERLNSVHQKAFNKSREGSSTKSINSLMNTTITVPNDNYNGDNIGYRRNDIDAFRDSNNCYDNRHDGYQQQQQQQHHHQQQQQQNNQMMHGQHQMSMNFRAPDTSSLDFQMQMAEENNRERELRLEQMQYEEDVRMFQLEQDRMMNSGVGGGGGRDEEFEFNCEEDRGRGSGTGNHGQIVRQRAKRGGGGGPGSFRGREPRSNRGRGGRGGGSSYN